MSGPSDKAVQAAMDAFDAPRMRVSMPSKAARYDGAAAVHAAHDPALGLDRSVCLRDVVEFLRDARGGAEGYATLIEREFGAS